MKNTARFVAVVFAMVLSVSAMAKGQFDPAQRAMMDSQWGRAEELLKANIEKEPNNGKGHYLLATVYEQTRRYSEAQAQLDIANRVAPDQRWAGAGQATAMANRLSVKLAANNPQPRTQPRERTRVADEPRVAYTPPAHQTQVATTTSTPSTSAAPQQSGGHGFLLFMVFLVVVGGAGLGIYYYMGRRTEKEAEDRLDAGRRALQATAVDMQTRVNAIRDALKFQNKAGSELGLSIDNIAANLNQNANALRDRAIETSTLSRARSNLDTLETQLSKAEGRLARKDFDPAPAPARAPEPVRAAPTPAPTPAPAPYQPTYTAPPAPRYVAPAPTPAPVQQPQVVHHHHETIVHDNTGSDLLTAVVIADVMSNSRRDDELRRERERNDRLEQDRRDREFEADMQRKRERQEREDQERQDREDAAERRRQDEEDSRSRYTAPAMDFGGRDDDDDRRSSSSSSDSSSDSPSMDFGGSDD